MCAHAPLETPAHEREFGYAGTYGVTVHGFMWTPSTSTRRAEEGILPVLNSPVRIQEIYTIAIGDERGALDERVGHPRPMPRRASEAVAALRSLENARLTELTLQDVRYAESQAEYRPSASAPRARPPSADIAGPGRVSDRPRPDRSRLPSSASPLPAGARRMLSRAPSTIAGPMDQSKIRNFSIIAHIDHGKSTLADRILEITEAVSAREMREQLLDSMDLERERGITIKAQAVRVSWKGHELNLIDTPGHVDFTYEVSRSLQACEGALLVVDAAQGIEAQTLANAYLAIENGLEIVPVVNKIDLPQADPDGASIEVADLLGDDPARVVRISAKTGHERRPGARRDHRARAGAGRRSRRAAARARLRLVVRPVPRRARVRARDRRLVLARARRCRRWRPDTRFDAEELGFFSPTMTPVESLTAGEVGYVVTGLKDVSIAARRRHAHVRRASRAPEPLPGLQGREADGVRRALPDGLRRRTRSCATRSSG